MVLFAKTKEFNGLVCKNKQRNGLVCKANPLTFRYGAILGPFTMPYGR
jgi:hypothetical protein